MTRIEWPKGSGLFADYTDAEREFMRGFRLQRDAGEITHDEMIKQFNSFHDLKVEFGVDTKDLVPDTRTSGIVGGEMIWRPYLPVPQPAYKEDPNDPEPVPLDVLRHARDLCANFRVPPRRFRRRTTAGVTGWYHVASDTVAVNPWYAAVNGLGGDDGYYVTFIEELLHATGHPRRLGRPTVSDHSAEGNEAEERTINAALRIVLAEIGFPRQALEFHIRGELAPHLVDQEAAERAAGWFLNGFAQPQRLAKEEELYRAIKETFAV